MISQETKECIANEAVNYYTGPNLQYSAYDKRNRVVMAYIAGAEAEATRAEGLATHLESLINIVSDYIRDLKESGTPISATAKDEEILNKATEALNNYNKTDK